RDRGEQLERLDTDALRVEQMAGWIVRHVQIERRAGDRSLRTVARQQLGDITDPGAEPCRAVVAEQMSVLLHEGPTPRAVHDDGRLAVTEGLDVGARKGPGVVEQAGVRVEGSAADLAARRLDVIAIHGQGARGGIVDVGEEAVLDTAPEQLDGKGR